MTEKSFSFFNTNSSHCFFSSTILSDGERHPQSPLDDTLFKSYTTTSSSQAGLLLLRCGIIMLANQADDWERRRLPLSLSLPPTCFSLEQPLPPPLAILQSSCSSLHTPTAAPAISSFVDLFWIEAIFWSWFWIMVSPYSVAQSFYLLHTVFLKKRPRMPIIGKKFNCSFCKKQIKNQTYLQAMRCAILHSTSAAPAGISTISSSPILNVTKSGVKVMGFHKLV